MTRGSSGHFSDQTPADLLLKPRILCTVEVDGKENQNTVEKKDELFLGINLKTHVVTMAFTCVLWASHVPRQTEKEAASFTKT